MIGLRQKAELTQDDMAGALEINLKTYQKYEYRQAFPGPDRLDKIAEILNVTVADLFWDDKNPPKKATAPSRELLLGSLAVILPALNERQLRDVVAMASGHASRSSGVQGVKTK
jgi:transcriptional regulator with XRE-family HTH domain